MTQSNNKSPLVLSMPCVIALAVMSSGLITGCQAHKAEYSGFLGDYSKLRPSPEVEDALYYQDPGKSLKDYDKFIIDPVLLHFAPNAKGTALDPAKLKEMTDFVRDEAVMALSKRYEVVDAPGPGVLRLRAAVTDIKKSIPAMNIHPATKLSGVGLGGASMEVEAIDSQSGLRVFAVVDTRQGNQLALTAGLSELGHAKQVIKHWIERFVARVDKAHGYSGR